MTYSERLLSVNEENHTMIINPSSVFGKTSYNVGKMVVLGADGLGEFGQQFLFPYTNVAGGLGAFGAVSALTVETLQID